MRSPVATLDRLAASVGTLYSLPAVAAQVLELTRNPQVDAHALKACIENDPALTSKILRVVNSSLFGLSREVSDLHQALALLGTKPLKLLVLGFSLPSGLFAGVEAKILGQYWRHTLTKAVAAREIAENVWNLPGDEAFIAGLLQDLGMLVLVKEVGEPYIRLLDKVEAADKDLSVAEVAALGFNHTTLSARLLGQWGLPQPLVEAVAWGTPLSRGAGPLVDAPSLAQVLHLAELVARLLADGHTRVLGELIAAGRGYRNLSRAQLEDLVATLEEKVAHLATVLSLQLPRGLNYSDVLSQAHVQLSAVADEAAVDLVCQSRDDAKDKTRELEDVLLPEDIAGLAAAVAEAVGQPSQPAGEASAESAVAVAPAAPSRTDSALVGRLAVAVVAARQARCPLSLLLVQFDHADQLIVIRGTEGFRRMRQLLEAICRRADDRCSFCAPHDEAGFAMILLGCERRQAVAVAGELIAQVRRIEPTQTRGGPWLASISVGVATVSLPPKNFPPDDLLSAAARCLYGSHVSGGGVVKSIEI